MWLQHLAHVARDDGRDGDRDALGARRRHRAQAARAGRRAAGRGRPGADRSRHAWRNGSRRSPVCSVRTSATGPRCGCAATTSGTGRWPSPPPTLADRVLALGSVAGARRVRCGVPGRARVRRPARSPRSCRASRRRRGSFAALTAIGGAQLAGRAADHRRRRRSGCSRSPRRHPTGYDEADVALAADLGQRLATMVAAERLAARGGSCTRSPWRCRRPARSPRRPPPSPPGSATCSAPRSSPSAPSATTASCTRSTSSAPPRAAGTTSPRCALTRRVPLPDRRAAPAGRSGCPTGRPSPSAIPPWRPTACPSRPRASPRCRCSSASGWSARSR